MSEIPSNTPEKRDVVPDNDRKFVVDTIDLQFLAEHNTTAYMLATNWLETNKTSETKIVRKKFDDGSTQILHIAKVTVNGDRTAQKTKISEEQYQEYLDPSMPHTDKRRHEFNFTQDGVDFTAKYDEFTDSNLRILEIGAKTPEDRALFNPENFSYKLTEVSDNSNYSGFRVAELI